MLNVPFKTDISMKTNFSKQQFTAIYNVFASLLHFTDVILHYMMNVILALFFIVLLSPLFVWRSVMAKLRTGYIFNHIRLIGQHRLPFTVIEFTDKGTGYSLPMLFNILRGEMNFIGPKALISEDLQHADKKMMTQFNVKPGLYTMKTTNQMVEPCYTETISGNIRLFLLSFYLKMMKPLITVEPLSSLESYSIQKCDLLQGNEEYYELPRNHLEQHSAFSKYVKQSWYKMKLYQQGLKVQHAQATGLWLKRSFDILVSGMLLILLAPFLALVILAIRLDSPGSPFFYQKRVGKNGKLFKMWKFRSMYKDAEARKAALMAKNEMEGGVLFKMKNDPRITRVGRFLRKFSIDEMPQLWNVFVGDMSLVGPRPPIIQEVAQYTPYQRQRLNVTPGITCIWQVSGRSTIPFEQQVEMDIEYIQRQSFWFDIVLLFKTIPAVISGKGAY